MAPPITPPARIAFVGLGAMGGHMAANLSSAGFEVLGWNRTPGKPMCEVAEQGGVKIVGSITEAVRDAKAVFTCVGDVPDVEAVMLGSGGVCHAASPGTILVDTSTIGKDAAKSIGCKLVEKGFRFVDAPVSGGDVGAKAGTLTIMAGGDKGDVDEVMPCFEAIGKSIVHCGQLGNGQAVKICNQVLCGVHLVALCEALTLAEKQGLDPKLIPQVCSTGAAGSWALANLGPMIVNKNYTPGFMIRHMQKDLRLVQATAGDAGLDMPGTSLAQHFFSEVEAMGGLEMGTQAMMKAFEKKA